MRLRGLFILAIAGALSAGLAYGQAPDGLRDPLPPPYSAAPPAVPRTMWTPSALRVALTDAPITPGGLPQGYGVQRVETRTPTPDERATGMAFRVDVLLSGPNRAQSISYRVYDTPETALAATRDKTLGDRSVTLTRQSVDLDLRRTFANGISYPCAQVRSASFTGLLFMRCYQAVNGMPIVAGASVGAAEPTGDSDAAQLDAQMQPAGALLSVAMAQVNIIMIADPDGSKAYMRDLMRGAPAAAPAPVAKKRDKDAEKKAKKAAKEREEELEKENKKKKKHND